MNTKRVIGRGVSAYHAGHVCSVIFDGGPAWQGKKGTQFQEQEVAELLPLTVPEIRRLLWRLVWQAPPTPEGVLHWSHGRRSN